MKLKSKDESFRRTRRDFAKRLAAVAATPLIAKAGIAATAEATAAGQAQSQTNPFAPQAEALAEVVRRRYPDTLTGEQLEAVKRGIERALRNADALRKFDLSNGDEPAFVFSADLLDPSASAAGAVQGGREGKAGEAREPGPKRKPHRNR